MLQALFHAWERRLASITTDRVVRPFDWGLDWIPANGHRPDTPPSAVVGDWVAHVMADTDALFTPHEANNTVHCRYFPARGSAGPGARAAVLVLPQWNSDTGGHVGLCRLLAWNGIAALRLSLPYHDERMPPELHRADYIVSANIARTVQVCRQAVLDARRAIAWLAAEGY